MSLREIKKALKSYVNPEKRDFFPHFFQAKKGGYGEGDRFLGVTVPHCRKVAKENKTLAHRDALKLLHSPWHEERLTAIFIFIHQFEKGSEELRTEVFNDLLQNTKYINNWDLVDACAPKIFGPYLRDRSHKILFSLSRSDDLWERRISIISTLDFIRDGRFETTLKISKTLLRDEHDLIHKAVGWMVREVGNRDRKELEKFLSRHYQKMPRTMLRYAIEKLPESRRQKYLKGKL